MNVSNDMSLFTLLSGASVPVQMVMALLVITSLVSWWYIFIKAFTIKRAEKEAVDFEEDFWRGGDLNKLYESVTGGRRKVTDSRSMPGSSVTGSRSAMSPKVPAAPCAPHTTGRWTIWTRICHSWPRSVR